MPTFCNYPSQIHKSCCCTYCISLSPVAATMLHGFVKAVAWICQCCSMYFYPFAKQNQAEVWPRFQILLKPLFWIRGVWIRGEWKYSMPWVRCAFCNVFIMWVQTLLLPRRVHDISINMLRGYLEVHSLQPDWDLKKVTLINFSHH